MNFKTGMTKPINMPLQDAWQYFIEPNNWSKWYGGNLKKVEPGWEKGGMLIWEQGRPSIIQDIIPLKEIILKDRTWGIITKWNFNDSKGGILIEVEEEFGSTRPGSESEWREGWREPLNKLRQCLITSISSEKKASKESPWWKFW